MTETPAHRAIPVTADVGSGSPWPPSCSPASWARRPGTSTRDSDPVPSAERPVVPGEVAHGSAVESAARSTSEILSYGFEDFDAQIDDATTKMTEPFAEEFRDTTAEVKDRFVEERITQEVRIVASSVVSASDQEVRALLFLDLYVAKAGEATSVTPYRALVTVHRSDGRWLVSDIQTV